MDKGTETITIRNMTRSTAEQALERFNPLAPESFYSSMSTTDKRASDHEGHRFPFH